jgi:hypothetical protein
MQCHPWEISRIILLHLLDSRVEKEEEEEVSSFEVSNQSRQSVTEGRGCQAKPH